MMLLQNCVLLAVAFKVTNNMAMISKTVHSDIEVYLTETRDYNI